MKSISRYQMKDKASVYHRTIFDRIRTWWQLGRRGVPYGRNCIVKANVEIRLTDNAILEMGENVVIERYVFIQLTRPNPHLVIGNHTSIGRGTILVIKGHTTIGSFTMIGPNCQINDQNHSFARDDLIMNQKAKIAPVAIGNDCWFGSGVRVVAGVTIGDGVVVGAGSVVTRDIPCYEIWAGVPARFIKRRD